MSLETTRALLPLPIQEQSALSRALHNTFVLETVLVCDSCTLHTPIAPACRHDVGAQASHVHSHTTMKRRCTSILSQLVFIHDRGHACVQANGASASPTGTIGCALPVGTGNHDKVLLYNAVATEAVVIYDASAKVMKASGSPGVTSGSAFAASEVHLNSGNDQLQALPHASAANATALTHEALASPATANVWASTDGIADGAFDAAGDILTRINTCRVDKAALYAAAAANDRVVIYDAQMASGNPSSALIADRGVALATTGVPPLTAIDTSREGKALLYDAAANSKVLIYDAAATPVTSPPIAAFGIERSPFLGFKPKSPDVEVEGCLSFDRPPMSVDGGEYLRRGLFPERPAEMSVDGGEFLRHGLFPEREPSMSVDGREFLRHGIFPEAEPAMSVDGGEYLRHTLFSSSPFLEIEHASSVDSDEFLCLDLFLAHSTEMSVDGGECMCRGIFPETEPAMSVDGGEFLRCGLFPERPAEMSVDGGEFLRHTIFPELEPAMSVDGGEYLRHGLFSERRTQMSADGGEFLRRGLFPEVEPAMSFDGGEFLRHGLFAEGAAQMSVDGGEFLRRGLFPEAESALSVDGGEFLRRGLFSEQPSEMSVDGGEFLRRGLFPELKPAMSVDGGEFLRHGLFPERPAQMSVDGGEYLRHAIFPDSPTPTDEVRLALKPPGNKTMMLRSNVAVSNDW